MSIKKKHNRKLGLCAADMVKNLRLKVRDELTVMGKVRDDLEREVINSDYLVNAPFEWLTISLRFGLKNEDKPHYQKINKSYGDLPLAIELDAHELRVADESELQVLLTVATLKALIHAGNKYDLPVQVLEERLDELRENTKRN